MGLTRATCRSIGVVLVFASVLGVFAACLIPATETLTGASFDGGVLDASTVETSADVAVDVADAPTDAPDAGNPLCTGALFCDDFERGTLLGSWTRKSVANGGALDLFTASSTALRFTYSGVDASASGPAAYLEKSGLVASVTKGISITFDAYVDVGLGTFNIAGIEILFGNNLAFSSIFAVNDGGGAVTTQVYDLGNGTEIFYDSRAFDQPVPKKKWFKGKLETKIAGTTGTAVASLEGVVVSTRTAPNVQPGSLLISAGCSFSYAPKGTGTIYVDNVRVDGSP